MLVPCALGLLSAFLTHLFASAMFYQVSHCYGASVLLGGCFGAVGGGLCVGELHPILRSLPSAFVGAALTLADLSLLLVFAMFAVRVVESWAWTLLLITPISIFSSRFSIHELVPHTFL